MLSDLAEQMPLLVLLDDAQWFDQPSISALSFAARRLAHEGIVMIFAVRDGERGYAGDGLPELRLARLDDADAVRFLSERRPDLPMEVRGRVIEEAAGNPLALLELSGRVSSGPLQHGVPVAGSPVAAADDTGDVVRILAAARAFQATHEDLEPAERAGLIAVDGSTVTFRHPLVRAAAYHGPPFGRRLAAHAALAATCESPEQADRHAWHRSASVVEPDDDVAAELEQAAARAEKRGGHATAASAYERAAALSAQESTRVRRLGHAAVAALTPACCRMRLSCYSGFPPPTRSRRYEPPWCQLPQRSNSSTEPPARPHASSSMPRLNSAPAIRLRQRPG